MVRIRLFIPLHSIHIVGFITIGFTCTINLPSWQTLSLTSSIHPLFLETPLTVKQGDWIELPQLIAAFPIRLAGLHYAVVRLSSPSPKGPALYIRSLALSSVFFNFIYAISDLQDLVYLWLIVRSPMVSTILIVSFCFRFLIHLVHHHFIKHLLICQFEYFIVIELITKIMFDKC